MTRVLRRWHRWGRLSWYLGTNTKGASYGWRWFRPASGFANARHANLGKLHIVWHGRG